jgi:hypothetical protein
MRFNKSIHEDHVYIVILVKDFDLAIGGSFYCDYTHLIYDFKK